MANEWEVRNSVAYFARRIVAAHDAYQKAQSAVPSTGGGSGLTPFLADVSRSLERLDKEIDELMKFVRSPEAAHE